MCWLGTTDLHIMQNSIPFLWFAVVTAILLIIWFQVRRIPKYSFVFILGLLLFVGVMLLLVSIPYVNAEFSHALGHAFIIATILAATVDHYLKKRVLREVTSDISKYLVGYRLPTEVQGRIGDLMRIKWIRRRFDLRVAFAEVDGGERIKVDFQISDEVQNISSETLDYRDKLEFDSHEPVSVVELQCDCPDSKSCYYMNGEALDAIRTENSGRVIFGGQLVRIPPVEESIGGSYCFRARYELTQPTKFSELISFNIPTIGVSIEITDHPEDYSFHISPVADHMAHNRWEFRRLFLPGEHIKILWERKRA
jgi:hypothetical protein